MSYDNYDFPIKVSIHEHERGYVNWEYLNKMAGNASVWELVANPNERFIVFRTPDCKEYKGLKRISILYMTFGCILPAPSKLWNNEGFRYVGQILDLDMNIGVP